MNLKNNIVIYITMTPEQQTNNTENKKKLSYKKLLKSVKENKPNINNVINKISLTDNALITKINKI